MNALVPVSVWKSEDSFPVLLPWVLVVRPQPTRLTQLLPAEPSHQSCLIFKKYFIYLCVCVCVHASAQGGRERVTDPMMPELQAIESTQSGCSELNWGPL